MPLQVGIVGLPNSGKTTLFNVLTHAGAEVTAYASVTEKANVVLVCVCTVEGGAVCTAMTPPSCQPPITLRSGPELK